ncbi:MAG: multicopper oxidase domain-containing protein, partial [Cycloclasticus sp.]|nr:multicopper oxidase domain-containing protein [Cycloclasticus sp.]
MKKNSNLDRSRRRFVTGVASATVLSGLGLFAPFTYAASRDSRISQIRGNEFDLTIGYQAVNFTGKESLATSVNGSVPGPTLYWQEGQEIIINVTNTLSVTSSIHWHGIILPAGMDGVPGLSFDGIPPGGTFTYRFKVQQSGTYW